MNWKLTISFNCDSSLIVSKDTTHQAVLFKRGLLEGKKENEMLRQELRNKIKMRFYKKNVWA